MFPRAEFPRPLIYKAQPAVMRCSSRSRPILTFASLAGTAALAAACASGGASETVRPPRPQGGVPAPIPDPPPSRVVLHATIFAEGIQKQLDLAIPAAGAGEVELFAGKKVPYQWSRAPIAIRFDRGRMIASTKITGTVRLLGEHDFEIALTLGGEPVISADYRAQIQSPSVEVAATGPVEKVSRLIEERLKGQISTALDGFRLDVKPLLTGVYQRITAPIPLAFGGETACAQLRVTGIEAGPTVLAGGMEKDLGVVVLPSVTLPCAPTSTKAVSLPLLANVSSIPSGPFSVVVPVAANYTELSRALDASIKGRLHFSKEYPELYLEKPEVFPANETLVIRLVLGGQVTLAGIQTDLGGELYFSGHPRVVDNQIVVPDLELTPGTADALLRIKLALDGRGIRDQAQAALRFDVSERLMAVRDKLSTELSFSDGLGCVRAEVLRTEVTGVFPHQTFLRIYVQVDAQASVYLPCKRTDEPAPAASLP